MGTPFIDQEVEKIFKDTKLNYPLNAAMAATWIIGNFKGFNLKIIDMRERSSLADYFVLASTDNSIQSQAIATEILEQNKKHGGKNISFEGKDNGEWLLLDLGDVIVNIFLDTTREIFDLDQLWKEAPLITIPQSYYHSYDDSNDNDKSNDNESYF